MCTLRKEAIGSQESLRFLFQLWLLSASDFPPSGLFIDSGSSVHPGLSSAMPLAQTLWPLFNLSSAISPEMLFTVFCHFRAAVPLGYWSPGLPLSEGMR